MGQSQSGQEAACFRANRGTAKVFGRRSRSGVDEIRAEQTDINTSPQRNAHTDAHTHASADTWRERRKTFFTENKKLRKEVCRERERAREKGRVVEEERRERRRPRQTPRPP